MMKESGSINEKGDLKWIVEVSFKTFLKSFAISFTFRVLTNILTRLPSLLRGRLQLEKLVKAISDESSLRTALFMGCFSGGYTLIKGLLDKHRGENRQSNGIYAALIASFALLLEGDDQRKEIAQNVFVRALHCLYRILVSREKIKPVPNGEVLMFALSAAQVMYAYSKHPDTIPQGFYQFIVNTGPIPEFILKQGRLQVANLPVEYQAINEYCVKRGGPTNILKDAFPPYLPAAVLHPQQSNKVLNAIEVFLDSYGKVLPLYVSVTFFPLIMFHSRKLIQNPVFETLKSVLSASRSSSYLAGYVALYMLSVSTHRKMLEIGFAGLQRDHKLVYYISGLIASLSILIEKSTRRTEFALYCMPKAMVSLFLVMEKHQLVRRIDKGEVLLFAVAMPILLFAYEFEQDVLDSMWTRLFSLIVP